MSTRTETMGEKFQQWKRDLEGQCSAWLESHPEGAESLDMSDILPRPVLTKQLGTGGRPFPDNVDPRFQSRLLPDEVYEKITVREIRQGSWAVFVGTTMVDAFHGEGALQKANEKAERLADARQ